MKKLTLTFAAALLIIQYAIINNQSQAQSKVFIPDINFRFYLNTNYPTFMDGSGDSLLIDSAATLTNLNCTGQSIADLTGVEYFVNITNLDCSWNQLTSLPDLTNNTALQGLFCYGNQLISLPDLTGNTALSNLDCNGNQLTSLPGFTNNTALQWLVCYDNQLTSLPALTNNPALQWLWCYNNQLTSLPALTNNTALVDLYCYNNQLTSLPNLTTNTALLRIRCYFNQLTSLPDLSNNTALIQLFCYNNKLTALPDLTNNTALVQLWCNFNKLNFSSARELRIADTISTLTMYTYSPQNPFGTPATFELDTGDTIILSIASQDSALSYQWFVGTDTIVGATDTFLILANVTVAESGVYSCKSYGTALNKPPMTWNPGISSFVSEFFIVIVGPRLKAFIPDINFRDFLNTTYPGFIIGDSLLTDSAATITGLLSCSGLNIADITGLEWFFNIQWLHCYNNLLTTLPDMSAFTNLKWLHCYDNQLTSLPDLSASTNIQQLYCYNNQLTALPNLSSPNFSLQKLYCEYNQLTALPDLSSHFVLQRLYCNDNQITSLPDLANTDLAWLYCWRNKLDFSDARELRIADAILTLTAYAYSPQNPFGTADTFNLNTGDTLILSIASQDSALSYQWFRGTDTITGATDTLLIIPNVLLTDSGIYTCRSYGTALGSPPMIFGPGISSFISEPLTVNILSASLSASISYQQNVSCNGGMDGEAAVTVTGGSPPYTLQWSDSSAQITDTAYSLFADIYYVVVTDSLGAVDTALLTITEPPAITGSQTLTICAGDSVIVGTSVYNTTGVYTDIFTASNGCDSTVTTNLTVNPLPTVSFTGLDTSYCLNDAAVTLTGTPTGGTFSGTGISSSQFNPANADTGTHTITYTYTDGNNCTDSISQNVTVNNCLGINDQSSINNDQLKVYPNPNTGEFTVTFKITEKQNINLKVINIKGQVIYEENLSDFTGQYQNKINMSGYLPAGQAGAKGIYNLQLSTKEKTINRKIILE